MWYLPVQQWDGIKNQNQNYVVKNNCSTHYFNDTGYCD